MEVSGSERWLLDSCLLMLGERYGALVCVGWDRLKGRMYVSRFFSVHQATEQSCDEARELAMRSTRNFRRRTGARGTKGQEATTRASLPMRKA